MESIQSFESLGLAEPLLRALRDRQYTTPTPIQAKAIPPLLEGLDLMGSAQTGTGKTAAFTLPILHRMAAAPKRPAPQQFRTLVLTPTRELAVQVAESFREYGKHQRLSIALVYGGVGAGPQIRALERGLDILVATPGRLLDLIGQGFIDLSTVTHSVLDEADHMLDMGFIHDIKKIVRLLPQKRQSLFFSATMSKEIESLSRNILGQPARITIQPEQATAEKVDQALYYVSKPDKRKLLLHLLEEESMESLLVFSRTKHGANKIVKILERAGHKAAAIHGNKSQNARQKALGEFKDGALNVLVATDIAARGIDVDELSHVINYDLPNVPETYVHRIGRTGRAKASGIAISFCDTEERTYLKDIQKLIDQRIPVISDHPYPDNGSRPETVPSNNPPRGGRKKQRNQRNGRNRRRS